MPFLLIKFRDKRMFRSCCRFCCCLPAKSRVGPEPAGGLVGARPWGCRLHSTELWSVLRWKLRSGADVETVRSVTNFCSQPFFGDGMACEGAKNSILSCSRRLHILRENFFSPTLPRKILSALKDSSFPSISASKDEALLQRFCFQPHRQLYPRTKLDLTLLHKRLEKTGLGDGIVGIEPNGGGCKLSRRLLYCS